MYRLCRGWSSQGQRASLFLYTDAAVTGSWRPIRFFSSFNSSQPRVQAGDPPCSRPSLAAGSPVRVSPRGRRWTGALMYGTGHAPLLGTCWPPVVAKPKSEVLVSSMDSTKEGGKNLESLAQDSSSDSSLDSGRSEEGEERGPYSAHSFTAQMLYCKAAVSASGGHRLARDYLAALTAAVNGDARLLHLCLHHPVREEDIEVFRTHLLDVWCAEEAAVCEEEAKQGQPKNGASPTHVSEASADEDCSEEYLQAAELFVLSCSPIVRCFLYDVMCAASYQRTQNLTLMEATEKEMVRLGVDCFGIPQERLLALWKIVLAEVQLRKETFNILVPLME